MADEPLEKRLEDDSLGDTRTSEVIEMEVICQCGYTERKHISVAGQEYRCPSCDETYHADP